MIKPLGVLTASSPASMHVEAMAFQEKQIREILAHFEPTSATLAWLDKIRAMEECINLMYADWDDDEFELGFSLLPLSQHFHRTQEYAALRTRLIKKFSENFANRFCNLVNDATEVAANMGSHGFLDVAHGFSSIASMIGYLQSRRRHFLALLYLLPRACIGVEVIPPQDVLRQFLPIVEMFGIGINSSRGILSLKMARSKLGLPEQSFGQLAMLDKSYLEIERAPLTGMPITETILQTAKGKEELQGDRLFSAAELRNDILHIEAAYGEFALHETDFGPAAEMLRRLSRDFVEKDFWVIVPPDALDALFEEFKASVALRAALVNSGTTYLECLASYAPFFIVRGTYYSTVTLLSRFIYNWRDQCLARRKRYQVRSGFIFEEGIRNELCRQGFTVREDIRRIERKEFDVVAVRDGIIWNIQCKNNFKDLKFLESDPTCFANFNFTLVKSYEAALRKELGREFLLKNKLGISKIQHMVVSKFPVVSDNPRFVPENRMNIFGKIADSILDINPGY